jgi:nucleotide-binding universal stress UspA family protein
MSVNAIVSYDGTPNDQDALKLARVLSDAGVDPILVYVRHSTLVEPAREQLEEHEAQSLLERGAQWLGEPATRRRVVLSPSTPEGLQRVAAEENASLIVFGSEYRTAPGHVAAPRSAQALLEGGTTAVAIAPAAYRQLEDPRVRSIGVLAARDDEAAASTAEALGAGLGAGVGTALRPDLLVVGSRPEAMPGRVLISAQSQYAIDTATAPVIVLARAVALPLRQPAVA